MFAIRFVRRGNAFRHEFAPTFVTGASKHEDLFFDRQRGGKVLLPGTEFVELSLRLGAGGLAAGKGELVFAGIDPQKFGVGRDEGASS
jgi:hypothetical protein